MDNPYVERQCRLLVDSLYASWGQEKQQSFVAMTNVGLFFAPHQPPLVPDVLVSLDVALPADLRKKEHRSYFIWLYGQPPTLIIEIVSDRRGGETTLKMQRYIRIGVRYYVIYDPDDLLREGVLRVLELQGSHYEPVKGNYLSEIDLGLTFWQGTYQGAEESWLRWCDRQGRVFLTAQEGRDQEHQRAEQEHQRAEQERQRAEKMAERAKHLEALLRRRGSSRRPESRLAFFPVRAQ